MSPLIAKPFFLGWSLCLLGALVALLKWNYRRATARRMAKGLRSYAQAIS